MGGHVECMRERRGVYRVFVGKTEGKKAPGRPRRRGKDNIKMDVHDGVRDMDCINLTQDRERCLSLVNAKVNC